MPAQTKRGVGRATRCISLILTAVLLAACNSSDSPTETPDGLDLPSLVEFRGMYIDASTCVKPGDGSSPITIWLFDYDVPTGSVSAAVRYREHGGSHTSAEQFRGTLTRSGELQAFSFSRGQINEEIEIKATVTPTRIFGDVYDYCSNGTADIWRFTADRHSP